MARAKSRRGRKTTKAKAKRGKKRAARTRARSGARRKSAAAHGRKKKTGAKRKRTTAEGMQRALKMKQAAERHEHNERGVPAQNWPVQMPPSVEPDPIPHNLREQGDTANILQNTSHRR